MDNVSLRVGEPWPDTLRKHVRSASILLVVVGQSWLSGTRANGVRCVDCHDDWVREEIRTAIEADIPILPIVIPPASMPPAAKLPSDITRLCAYQCTSLSETAFTKDYAVVRGRLAPVLWPAQRLGFRLAKWGGGAALAFLGFSPVGVPLTAAAVVLAIGVVMTPKAAILARSQD